MKNIIQFTVLLLFGVLLTVTSCTKDKNMTDEHKDWNVLEWTVDGTKYKASCKSDPLFGCDPVDCEYYHDTKYLYIIGTDNKTGIIIQKQRYLKVDTQNILTEKDFLKYGGPDGSDICTAFICDTNQHYSLFIEEIDTVNKIIVGNFSFTGIDNCKDTARVEDGYFKLTYRP